MNDQEITQKLDQMATKADVDALALQLRKILEIVQHLEQYQTGFMLSDHSSQSYQRTPKI